MMKLHTLILATALTGSAMCGTLAGDEPAQPVQLDEQTQALLDRIVEHFSAVETMQVTLQQSMEMTGMPFPADMGTTFTFSAQRPNLFRVQSEGPMGGATIVSDGTHKFVYYAMFDRYIKSDAPESFSDIGADAMQAGGADEGLMMFLMPLLAPEKIHESMGMVKSLEAKGEEEVNGITVQRYKLVTGIELLDLDGEDVPPEMQMMADDLSSLEYDIWLRTEPHPVPHRIDWDMTEMMREIMSSMPADMREELDEDMAFIMRVEFADWTFNEELDEQLFAFDVPEGAEQVESFMEAFQAGMGDAPQPQELLGREAPDFTLEMIDGRTVNLAEHRGQDIVVLDFWATWCGPCVQAMPDLIEATDAYADQNVVFYAINLQEERGRVKEFVEERGWDIMVPMDAGGQVADDYKVTGIPQTVIVHTDGTVQAVHVGMVPKEMIKDELEALLAGERLADEPDDVEEDDAAEEHAGASP